MPFFPVKCMSAVISQSFAVLWIHKNFDVNFCGSTIFRFPRLWIHKIFKKLSTHFVETQVRDSKFCGSTFFLKSTLWIHKMALKVV